jgi:transposase-like protein
LRKWFLTYYLISTTQKGISSIQLSRQIKITQKSAWYMLQKIRYANVQRMYGELMEGTVEADETYVGGKRKFSKRGRGAEHKTPVFGLLQRKEGKKNSQVRMWPVENVKGKTLKGIIKENVKKGSNMMTDEFRSYWGLSKEYKHKTVNHGAKEYVKGNVHTNGIENVWSHFKRSIRGIHHCPSRKHLEKYCAEFQFRFNTRDMVDINRFRKAIQGAKKSVKYRDITPADSK